MLTHFFMMHIDEMCTLCLSMCWYTPLQTHPSHSLNVWGSLNVTCPFIATLNVTLVSTSFIVLQTLLFSPSDG